MVQDIIISVLQCQEDVGIAHYSSDINYFDSSGYQMGIKSTACHIARNIWMAINRGRRLSEHMIPCSVMQVTIPSKSRSRDSVRPATISLEFSRCPRPCE